MGIATALKVTVHQDFEGIQSLILLSLLVCFFFNETNHSFCILDAVKMSGRNSDTVFTYSLPSLTTVLCLHAWANTEEDIEPTEPGQ
jgi:hypothetical protein